MRYKKLIIGIPVILLFLLSCAHAPVVRFETIKPPEINLADVSKIAVAEFHGPKGSGAEASYKLTEYLLQTKRFTVMEREKIRQILKEQGLEMSGAIDENSAVEIGKLLGVDALIFGDVTAYKIEDERGTKKVYKKVGTGRYKRVKRKNIFTGKEYWADEEIMKTVLVDEHYRIRRGVVTVNFKTVSVKTGELLAVKSVSESKEYKSVEGRGEIPPGDEILSKLLNKVVEDFAGMIAPIKIVVKRKLEKGSDLVNKGIKFAQNDLWSKAMETWNQEIKLNPSDAAAYYNLGVGYEEEGNFFKAKEMYSKAVDLNPKKEYMEALRRVNYILNKSL